MGRPRRLDPRLVRDRPLSTAGGGRVVALLRQPSLHRPLVREDGLRLVHGHGIEDDAHARPVGPRQVLVVAGEALDRFGITAEDLPANVVVRGVDLAPPSGRVLRLGARAAVRLTHRCETCRTLRPLGVDLRELAPHRGVLGVVVGDGTVRDGAAAALDAAAGYPPVPDAVGERFAWVVRRIPPGRVMTYRQILLAVGGTPAHARALPTYARRAATRDAPVHRVVDSAGELLSVLHGQRERLAAEGVAVDAGGRVDVDAHGWDGAGLYEARIPED